MAEERTRERKRRPGPPKTWTAKEADEAVQVLKGALVGVGITLPSVDRAYGELSMPLVELGRARPDVVVSLADCLTELVELRGVVKSLMEASESEKEAVTADG
ncbi:hypothetical protein [Streptomyces sp. NPDC002088]|uniref:hypothetical protein n=1 Tax=Streptomyces sp. NPDC002088 TaxID=3154665 RepID=UPI003333118F